FDVLHSLLPKAERERVSPAELREHWNNLTRDRVERLVHALRSALREQAPIDEKEDIALMEYGGGRRAKLIREEEGWCIESIE
ncbi:MAG: hypothetical protein NZM37_11170, partial [Sandaracinaceae bacterium]|nr:hypothetical protein [Sandaracinaceae bacterium]